MKMYKAKEYFKVKTLMCQKFPNLVSFLYRTGYYNVFPSIVPYTVCCNGVHDYFDTLKWKGVIEIVGEKPFTSLITKRITQNSEKIDHIVRNSRRFNVYDPYDQSHSGDTVFLIYSDGVSHYLYIDAPMFLQHWVDIEESAVIRYLQHIGSKNPRG